VAVVPAVVPGDRRVAQEAKREAGVTTVLWATGYRPAFGWIELPLFDDFGWPVQYRGVTEVAGLYFLGLHWLHTRRSSLLFGVGDDAGHVVSHLVSRPSA
jgi:putative flavoprotein involved in K+ transport